MGDTQGDPPSPIQFGTIPSEPEGQHGCSLAVNMQSFPLLAHKGSSFSAAVDRGRG